MQQEVSLPTTPDTGTRAKYLPLPLSYIDVYQLKPVNFYLAKNDNFTLYHAANKPVTAADIDRLRNSRVETIYVPRQEIRKCYQALQGNLRKIIEDTKIPLTKRSELVYSSSVSLLEQNMTEEATRDDILQVQEMAPTLNSLLAQDPEAHRHLIDFADVDSYVSTHMVNVCVSLTAFSRSLGLKPDEVDEIARSAIVIDIGNARLERSVLEPQVDGLHFDHEQVRHHVELGLEFLDERDLLSPIGKKVIGQHHERLDGSGYPHGLTGQHISLYGRMAAIVDNFTGMISERPYRDMTYTPDQALDEMEAQTPRQFDRDLFQMFAELVHLQLFENRIGRDVSKRNGTELFLPGQDSSKQSFAQRLKRFYLRLPVNARLLSLVNGKAQVGQTQRIIIQDISHSGVGLLSTIELREGQILHLVMNEVLSDLNEPLLATVRRCREKSRGWYAVGAEFLKPQSDRLIDALRKVTLLKDIPLT